MFIISTLYSQEIQIDKVKRVYDGDTFYVDLKDCNTKLLCENLPIRLKNIDTPEIRSKSKREKQLAKEAKDIAVDFLLGSKNISLSKCSRGKYFRLVCDVNSERGNLSEELIKQNLAVPYFGGTKTKNWDE